LGNPSAREWRLVRVAFSDSTALSPSCLQDGRFLVDFYVLHYSDVRYNAINQRYWLQYHSPSDIHTPTSSTTTHLIRPSDTSENHATHAKLVPFRCWINLTHTDTYLHGPFKFANVNGRKTRDRVVQADWDILSSFASDSTFINPLPRFDLPSYSIHVDPRIHVSYQDPAHALACAHYHNPMTNVSTDEQKALVSTRLTPFIFFSLCSQKVSGVSHQVKLCSGLPLLTIF
jgi:hypothetical protein